MTNRIKNFNKLNKMDVNERDSEPIIKVNAKITRISWINNIPNKILPWIVLSSSLSIIYFKTIIVLENAIIKPA